MQSTSDEVLIGRIANGDRLAMQVLYARYHVRVFRFVVRLVRDEATAEDVISEVFLDVWRQAGRFEGRSTIDMVAGDRALQGHFGAQASTGRGVG
jgi:RNA polymerase sigma-70 factor, ECF subfamily